MTTDELEKGLRHVEDMFERLVCPFILIGNTLKGICEDDKPRGDKVEVGLLKKYFTPEVRSTFTYPDLSLHFDNFVLTDDKISYEFEGIPIEIKVIHKKYKFFQNPDTLFHNYGSYLIPNPLESYWKVWKLVR